MIQKGDAVSTFAATPPIEEMRLLFSLAMSRRKGTRGKRRVVKILDPSRAHFLKPPDEDTEHAGDECLGLLKAVYELKDAGACFDACSENEKTERLGFCFIALGEEEDVEGFAQEIAKNVKIKDRDTFGPEANQLQEIDASNRVARWRPSGDGKRERVEIEAGGRHAEILIEQMSLNGPSKAVTSPGAKLSAGKD